MRLKFNGGDRLDTAGDPHQTGLEFAAGFPDLQPPCGGTGECEFPSAQIGIFGRNRCTADCCEGEHRNEEPNRIKTSNHILLIYKLPMAAQADLCSSSIPKARNRR